MLERWGLKWLGATYFVSATCNWWGRSGELFLTNIFLLFEILIIANFVFTLVLKWKLSESDVKRVESICYWEIWSCSAEEKGFTTLILVNLNDVHVHLQTEMLILFLSGDS